MGKLSYPTREEWEDALHSPPMGGGATPASLANRQILTWSAFNAVARQGRGLCSQAMMGLNKGIVAKMDGYPIFKPLMIQRFETVEDWGDEFARNIVKWVKTEEIP